MRTAYRNIVLGLFLLSLASFALAQDDEPVECPVETPIYDSETEACRVCESSLECMAQGLHLPICDTDVGTCGLCSSNDDCQRDNNQTDVFHLKCNTTTGACYPICSPDLCGDPDSLTGIIISYVVACIAILTFIIMFFTCGMSTSTVEYSIYL